jgi:hypothetical protein
MDRYGVETALLAYAGINARVSWWDPERYALVFREGDARIFVRRLPRFAPLIARSRDPRRRSRSRRRKGTRRCRSRNRPPRSPVADCASGSGGWAISRSISTARPRRARWRRTIIARWSAPDGCLAAADEARLAAWMGAIALGAGRAADALPLLDRARRPRRRRADDAGRTAPSRWRRSAARVTLRPRGRR